MVRTGFHASHEQIHPLGLLRAAQHAEEVGFDAAMCSDHWAPWGTEQGESGFAMAWLGSALATTQLPFGVVAAPGQRYHPAILAQAIGTLAAMFPRRAWIALGSGQNMNEHVTGDPWPSKEVRDARLVECVAIIRALLAGEEVSHHGLVRVDRAKLWTLPDVAPLLIGPAVSAATARRHAAWADGLVTVNQTPEALRDVMAAYRGAGGVGEVSLQVHVSFDPDPAVAWGRARAQWRGNAVGPPAAWDLALTEEFDAVAPSVDDEALGAAVVVEHDPVRLADRLAALAEIGFDAVYLHEVTNDVSELLSFLDVAAEHLLPTLKEFAA